MTVLSHVFNSGGLEGDVIVDDCLRLVGLLVQVCILPYLNSLPALKLFNTF